MAQCRTRCRPCRCNDRSSVDGQRCRLVILTRLNLLLLSINIPFRRSEWKHILCLRNRVTNPLKCLINVRCMLGVATVRSIRCSAPFGSGAQRMVSSLLLR